MSCKDYWEQVVAGKLSSPTRIATGQVDGGLRCVWPGCTALVNHGTGYCMQGHRQEAQESRAERSPGTPEELHGLLCAYNELRVKDVGVEAAVEFLGYGYEYTAQEGWTHGIAAVRRLMAFFAALPPGAGGKAAGEWSNDPRVRAAQMLLERVDREEKRRVVTLEYPDKEQSPGRWTRDVARSLRALTGRQFTVRAGERPYHRMLEIRPANGRQFSQEEWRSLARAGLVAADSPREDVLRFLQPAHFGLHLRAMVAARAVGTRLGELSGGANCVAWPQHNGEWLLINAWGPDAQDALRGLGVPLYKQEGECRAWIAPDVALQWAAAFDAAVAVGRALRFDQENRADAETPAVTVAIQWPYGLRLQGDVPVKRVSAGKTAEEIARAKVARADKGHLAPESIEILSVPAVLQAGPPRCPHCGQEAAVGQHHCTLRPEAAHAAAEYLTMRAKMRGVVVQDLRWVSDPRGGVHYVLGGVDADTGQTVVEQGAIRADGYPTPTRARRYAPRSAQYAHVLAGLRGIGMRIGSNVLPPLDKPTGDENHWRPVEEPPQSESGTEG